MPFHLPELALEISTVAGFLQLPFVDTLAARRDLKHGGSPNGHLLLDIRERTDHADRGVIGGNVGAHGCQSSAAAAADQKRNRNIIQMLAERKFVTAEPFCQSVEMPAPETRTENAGTCSRSGPFNHILHIQPDDMVRHLQFLAETFRAVCVESGKTGIERNGGQRETHRGPAAQPGKNMEQQHTVLAARNPGKDRIAVPDHRIVSDRRSGQFVNLVQHIHFRKSTTVFERKVTPEIKKIKGETARNEKKFAFPGNEQYIKAIMKVLVINGPNLNLLGRRKVEVYGTVTLTEIEARLRKVAEELGVEMDFFQSNSEGALVDRIGETLFNGTDGIVINPAAYTHTSVAVRDALEAVQLPAIEVHISNIHTREEFRNHSVTAPVCVGQVVGLGADGYEWAFRALVRRLECKKENPR